MTTITGQVNERRYVPSDGNGKLQTPPTPNQDPQKGGEGQLDYSWLNAVRPVRKALQPQLGPSYNINPGMQEEFLRPSSNLPSVSQPITPPRENLSPEERLYTRGLTPPGEAANNFLLWAALAGGLVYLLKKKKKKG